MARLIQFEVKYPRVGMVTIQTVRVSRDLSCADVYFTVLCQDGQTAEAAEPILTHAAGFLRSDLAKSLHTRITPKLRFHYDKIPEQADQMSRLINEARAKDHADEERRGDSED